MIVSIIAAMAENRVIGRNNKMPWDLPSDRKRFHAITREHPVIMGRKTFESIGRPLSRRTNIVLTRQKEYRAEGTIIVHTMEAALEACGGAEEVFICGGAEVFRETMSLVQRIYLTVIHRKIEGDAYFPSLPAGFTVVHRQEVRNDVLPHTLVIYEREGVL